MAQCMKIMIVEDEPEARADFCQAFTRYASMSLVYETGSEQQALEYLETHEVDVLILDIELEEGDGLSLLGDIETRGLKKPFVIVVTNTSSRVTLSYMRAHGADYIYQKANRSYSPAKVLSVIEKIYPYQRIEESRQCSHAVSVFKQEKEEQITRKYIEDELGKMGFRKKHVGFNYTVEAIFLLMQDKKAEQRYAANKLYELIADTYQTTLSGVERGIRNAIEAVFTGANVAALHKYYPFPYDEEKGRPTNTEFLKNMAQRLKI